MANLKENMSASELKYLLVLQEQLSSGNGILMITTIADKMGVSKASVSNALDRLMVRGYIKRDKKHIGITEKGNEVLNEYNEIIGFISKHLEFHCGVSSSQAYSDAVGVACVLSEASRKGTADFVRKAKESCRG